MSFMGLITTSDFNALIARVNVLDASLNALNKKVIVIDASLNALNKKFIVLDSSVNTMNKKVILIDASVNNFEKIFTDIKTKHNASTGLEIKDIDYEGQIISNEI